MSESSAQARASTSTAVLTNRQRWASVSKRRGGEAAACERPSELRARRRRRPRARRRAPARVSAHRCRRSGARDARTRPASAHRRATRRRLRGPRPGREGRRRRPRRPTRAGRCPPASRPRIPGRAARTAGPARSGQADRFPPTAAPEPPLPATCVRGDRRAPAHAARRRAPSPASQDCRPCAADHAGSPRRPPWGCPPSCRTAIPIARDTDRGRPRLSAGPN